MTKRVCARRSRANVSIASIASIAVACAVTSGCSGDDGAASASDGGGADAYAASDAAHGQSEGGVSDAGDTRDASGASDASDARASGDAGPDASDASSEASADASDASGACVDADGDGYSVGASCAAPLDCDDDDPFAHPGMLELADDGRDNDCSGGDLHAATGPGVYVNNAGGSSCSDTDVARGSKVIPYCSIWKAAQDAQIAGQHRDIFVAKGTYSTAWGTPADVGIFGGYEPANWSFDPVANLTTIGGVANVRDADATPATQWVAITASANVALQGFTITGGVQATPSALDAVWIGSTGKVVLARNVIAGGSAPQTLGVQIQPAAQDVLLLFNTVSAGSPQSSTAFGVNNLGNATLFGNRVDCGPGAPGMYAVAVQNYGTMGLAANVMNGGDVGASTKQTYGLVSTSANGNTATAWAVGNAIFGGRGQTGSYGVYSNGVLALIDNVIGGRSPVATAAGSAEVVGLVLFNGGPTHLHANDFFTPLTSGTAHLVQAPTGDAGFTMHDTVGEIDACAFGSCVDGGGTRAVDPSFVDASGQDFHLQAGSPCIGAGTDPAPWTPSPLARRDIDRQRRPLGAWDIGIDEVP